MVGSKTLSLAMTLAAVVPGFAGGAELSIEGATRHPTVSITPEDVARAKQRIEHDTAARAWFDGVKNAFAAWNRKDPAWVRSVMPGKGACFAYGFTGCPICGSRWGTWGGARASFEKPAQVTCDKGHVLPDADHPDSGTGYVGPDKRIHYFVGSYNAWVVENLIFRLATPAANVYLLTGDDRAGAVAASVLDELAVIYPSCSKGSWDYPSDPPSGRLDRPWYQVARVLVPLVDIYDRIHAWPGLDEPSAEPGLTWRQNIERNLLLNGAAYCYEQSVKAGGLHNGEADYLRGVLAVGVCLGIPEYVRWPVDGPHGIRAMLANNVDRDGAYFETSTGYGLHTRSLYLTFAEPLVNYRGSVYPNGLNLYDDPRFQAFFVLPQMAQNCQGHDLPYGDDSPIVKPTRPPYVAETIWDCMYSEYLAGRVSDPKSAARYASLNAHLRELDPDADARMSGMVERRVFHGSPAATSRPATNQIDSRLQKLLNGSFFFGQKGLAVLRQGAGEQGHAAAMRFGPSLVHGHLDDLSVNYFANGWELTYDIGYSLGSTHTQVGWAHQTASHNTVVVDESSQGGGMLGGSLHHFADWPGLKLVDASSNAYAHAGVSVYRRLFALADAYALDVFRVKGGRTHDLPMHSISTDVAFSGINFGKPKPGSLAGEKYAWGSLQLNDGDMKGYPNKPYWNPPPGNGYGFLVEPAEARADGNWSVTWNLDNAAFRLFALQDNGTVATALAPGLYPTFPKAKHVIRRRQGTDLSSCFVSIWESVGKGQPGPVQSIERIDGGQSLAADSGFALLVTLRNGEREVWLLGTDAHSRIAAKTGGLAIEFEGYLARCRLKDSQLLWAGLLEGRSLRIGDWRVELDSPGRSVAVAELPDSRRIRIRDEWPTDGRYDRQPVYFANPRYSRNSAYTVGQVRRPEPGVTEIQVEQVGTILGQGVVDKVEDAHTLTTRIPHEYARSVGRKNSTGFFDGKRLQADSGAATRIRSTRFGDPMTLDVDSTEGFHRGDTFTYNDVQVGDAMSIEHYCVLNRDEKGEYTYETNTDANVRGPDGVQIARK